MEGLRASGNGSASTMVPARMSTRSKSAKVISGFRAAPELMVVTSGVAERLEKNARQGFLRRRARPDDELKCLEIALAGLERTGEQHLDLLARRIGTAGQH